MPLRGPAPCPGPTGAWTGRGGGGTVHGHPENVLYLRYSGGPATPSLLPAHPAPWAGPAPYGRWLAAGLRSSGWLGWAPVLPTRLPTRYTHPVYPPRQQQGEAAAAVHCRCHAAGTTGACTYDRFEQGVGEPRGVEYRGVSGSQSLEYRPLHPVHAGPCRALLSIGFHEVSMRFP